MSYPPLGNGFVPGPPNGYQSHPPTVQQQYSHSQYPPAVPQSYNQQVQYWNQNIPNQHAHGMNGYSNGAPTYQRPPHAPFPQQQQYQPSHFISPAQTFHQPPPEPQLVPQYQPAPSNSHNQNNISPAFINPLEMGPMASNASECDTSNLLIALSEEYFAAAHQLAPSVSRSLNTAEMDVYSSLICTGLDCLATALKRVKLAPRVEAKIRLRYAGVLFEETDSHEEAETTLSHGIALCERNRYFDLKYAMQFLLAQFIAKKNPKASLKALDSHANEAQTYQHFSWVYAFRFLRASYLLESGGHVDIHAAVQNLRGIAAVAAQQQDYTIHMAASLLEAMAFMKSTSLDAVQNIQAALAKAWSNQLNVGNATQLIGLAHFIQVACSIRQGNPNVMRQKLQEMQSMMDSALKDGCWSTFSDTMAIPINRTSKSSTTVCQDTRRVLAIGEDGRDNLMLSFLSHQDAYAIKFVAQLIFCVKTTTDFTSYLLCGMVYLRRNPQDLKALEFFEEGVGALKGDVPSAKRNPDLLPNLLSKTKWRGEVTCYLRAYLAFQVAVLGDWKATKVHIEKLENTATEFKIPLDNPLGFLLLYLKGVYYQGTGEFDLALRIYEDKKLDLSGIRTSNLSVSDTMERDICILALLNKICVLQADGRRSIETNTAIIHTLEPLCVSHPNRDIQTAFNLVVATVKTNPEAQLYEIKRNLKSALNGAQATANHLFTCIILNVMCSRFFTDVVGPQAEKSAQAASVTASKTGNPLWKSVADGMLGRCYEVQGKTMEGRNKLNQARLLAQKAFPNS